MKEVDFDKIRTVLNIIFMVLFLVAVIVFFAADNEPMWFIYVCGAAIVVKIAEVILRFIQR